MAKNLLSVARKLTSSCSSKSAGLPSLEKSNQSGHIVGQYRQIHMTRRCLSLEEFFDDPKNFGEKTVKSGRPWSLDDLRLKSNTDIHKLWFVLFKERNMLYTMKEACEEENELFPSAERIDKVEISMANIENIVMERNRAYWKLEVSDCATGQRPSYFRRDVLGRHGNHKASQHLVPYSKNWKFRNSFGPGKHSETEWFMNSYKEMMRKHYNAKRSKTARDIREIFRRFPDADVDYIAEIHPEFPPGYVSHLKENLALYDDRPAKSTFETVRAFERNHNRERKLLD